MPWYKRAAVWTLWPIVYTMGWIDGYYKAQLKRLRGKQHD
jgi:hypothetical protein